MIGRWKRSHPSSVAGSLGLGALGLGSLGLGSLGLGSLGLLLCSAAPSLASPTRPAARPAPVVGHRPAPARPAAGPAAAHHKLRNRDQASFAQPIAGSAWEALGFKRRFLKVGDAWTMAWSSRKRLSIFKRTFTMQQRQTPKWAAPVVIHYRVSKLVTQDLGGHKRQVATITAVYGDRVRGRMQSGNELKVDQYFNPVERCVYTKWTPFGTCRDRDTRSVIRSMGAVPFFIGDLEHVQAKAASLPAVPPVFAKVRARVQTNKRFAYVPVHSGRRKYADTYWAPGDLVPTIVLGDNVQGVLIGQRVVR